MWAIFLNAFSHTYIKTVCISLFLFFGQDSIPHLVIAPNAGIAAYSSWLPTIVCLWYLNIYGLVFVFVFWKYTSLFFLNLVYCMSISGVDKGTKCPSGFFWLLWRSFSSGILLHKHRNWPPYDNSCMFTTSLSCLVMFAKRWIKTITDWIAIDNFVLQIQLNPFRQPMVIEDSALFLPCYSNCFLFGIWAGLLFHLFQ